MATNRVLIIRKEGEERRLPLDGARLHIGRDKKCEIILEDSSVSRRHAAILNKFGVIYIENLSPTGQILKAGQAVEFCELNEGENVEIGPFILSWSAEGAMNMNAAVASSGATTGAADDFALGAAVPAEVGGAEPIENDPFAQNNLEIGDADANNVQDVNPQDSNQGASQAEAQGFFSPPQLDNAVEGANDEAPVDFNLGQDIDNAPGLEMDNASGMMPAQPPALMGAGSVPMVSDGGTQIVDQALSGILKVIKGEITGREIKLERGSSWVVGRSAKSDIQIDSPKLSRQHFRIHRVGPGFRIEDLGSANGTRLNGVSITDSPLSSFDSIQAGPVELQFVLIDPMAQQIAPAVSSIPNNTNTANVEEVSRQKTVFAPPALFNGGGDFGGAGVFPGAPPSGNTFAKFDQAYFKPPQAPKKADGLKGKVADLKVWMKNQPPARKILYLLLLALIVGGLVTSQEAPTDETPLPELTANTTPLPGANGDLRDPASNAGATGAGATGATTPVDPAQNAAVPGQISPDFNALPKVKQDEIRDLYAKAERARAAKDWNTAFDSSQKILNQVKTYKDANEILAEAQTALNEDQIGMISKSLNDVEDAAKDNQDKIGLLIESGQKALSEKRWDDAAEAFQKALNLDPTNDKATQGFAAASAKNPNFSVSAPLEQVVDEDVEAKMAEQEAIDVLRRQFQDARRQMNGGVFREALPILKDLDKKLDNRIEEFDSGVRAPASIRDEYANATRRLQSKVKEALETAKQQMRIEYQTQLADADEFINNKQYVQAREIYDRIIKQEPAFEEPVEARQRLYAKIITEAKNIYQEGLIYESVGDLDLAVEDYQKSRDLLTNVDDFTAEEYYRRSITKLKRLQR